MKLESLTQDTGEWLQGTGPESDIVISSRMRLARNLADFPSSAGRASRTAREIEQFLRERIATAPIGKQLDTSTSASSKRSTGSSSSSGS